MSFWQRLFGGGKMKESAAQKPIRGESAVEQLRNWLDLSVKLAMTSGMDFRQQVDAMTQAGVPQHKAALLVNLFPIVAGRRFLVATGPLPKLADHYILIDGNGNEHAIPLAECPFIKAIEWRLNQLDPAGVLQIGIGSCEVVALNNMLTRLGPQATGADVAKIEIQAPRMGG